MAIYRDPTTVAHGAVGCTGVKSISCNGGGVPQTSRSDAGTFTHYVVSGGFSGQIITQDGITAAAISNQTTPASITFAVKDQVDTSKNVTITEAVTGGVQAQYNNGSPAGFSVPFVGATITAPA